MPGATAAAEMGADHQPAATHKYRVDEENRALVAALGRPQRVLDVGCGIGLNGAAAKRKGAHVLLAGKTATVTGAQAKAMYKELSKRLQAGYVKSGLKVAASYQGWKQYNKQTYQSATHGERYVNNYGNDTARDYGKYDGEAVLPVGSVIAKDSIVPSANGSAQPGPLFVMEKMGAGFNAASADWKYTLVMPDGSVIGETNGQGSANVTFCYECHAAAGASQMFFLPEGLRVGAN